MANSMAPTDFKRKTYKPPLLLTKNLAIIDTHCIHSSDHTYSPTTYNLWNGWLVGDILHILANSRNASEHSSLFAWNKIFGFFLPFFFFLCSCLTLPSFSNQIRDEFGWPKFMIQTTNKIEHKWNPMILLHTSFLTLGHLWWFS